MLNNDVRVRRACSRELSPAVAYTSCRSFQLQHEELFRKCELPLDRTLSNFRDRVLVDRPHDDWRLFSSIKGEGTNRVVTEDSHPQYGTVYMVIDGLRSERTGLKVKARFHSGDGLIPAQMNPPEAVGIWSIVQMREALLRRVEHAFEDGQYEDRTVYPGLKDLFLSNGGLYQDLFLAPDDGTAPETASESKVGYLLTEVTSSGLNYYTVSLFTQAKNAENFPSELTEYVKGIGNKAGIGYGWDSGPHVIDRRVTQIVQKTPEGEIRFYELCAEACSVRMAPLFDHFQRKLTLAG